MRVVETVGSVSSGRFARVYRDSERNEYRVRFFREGKHWPAADYRTDDKQDALDTATFVNGLFIRENTMQANLLAEVRLTRDAHGMCASSEAPLCIEGQSYVLEVHTRKVHPGVVTTRAVVVHRDEQGFSTHRVFQDYNRCVFETEHKRVTEKVIAEQHTQAIKVWDTLMAEATAHTKAREGVLK